jgi:hypothetical protein
MEQLPPIVDDGYNGGSNSDGSNSDGSVARTPDGSRCSDGSSSDGSSYDVSTYDGSICSDGGYSNGHNWIHNPRLHMFPCLRNVFDDDGDESSINDADGIGCNSCAICKRPASVRLTCTKELMCMHCTESRPVWKMHQARCSLGISCTMVFTELENDDDDDDDESEPEQESLEAVRVAIWDGLPIRGAMWDGWQIRINVYMCLLVNDLVPNMEGAKPCVYSPPMDGVILCLLYQKCPDHGLVASPQHCKFCEHLLTLIGVLLQQAARDEF